jgi:hypothetical protein
MSKRPSSEISKESNKKLCTFSPNTELESLKKELDSLLNKANDHHEEVRISAVDIAFDLEEKLKELEEAKQKASDELKQVSINLEVSTKYIQDLETNNAMQMLMKVSNSSITNIDTLKKDSKKAESTLIKLRSFKQTYKEKQAMCKDNLDRTEIECAKLKDKYNAAEHYVETITNLNQ